jgi:hypothetical protein
MSDDRTLPTTAGLSEDEFMQAAAENKGFTKDESVIPFTRIMQPLSPQMGSIPGMNAGDFLNIATNKVINGKEGMIVIPVLIKWNYTEWSAPQGEGGQFVQDWGEDETGWQNTCEPDQRNAYQPITKDGHVILKARHAFIFQIDEIGDVERSILPFSATSLKVARQWSSMMQYAPKISTRNGMMTPAYFYYTYKITTEEVKNNKGRWFQPKVSANIVDGKFITVLDCPNGKAIWDAAVALRDQLKAGEVTAAAQLQEPSDTI